MGAAHATYRTASPSLWVRIDQDGPLGPDPTHVGKHQRGTYEEQRLALAQDITRYRESRELPPLDQALELSHDDAHAAGRSL